MAEELVFRDATEADLAAIVAMLGDDSLGQGREDLSPAALEPYRAALRAISEDARNRQIVVERDGAVIGCMQLSFLPCLSHQGAERMLVEAVRVARDWRGHGVGASMMGWAVERARERGCRLVELATNRARTDAHRFYARLGFVQSHLGFKLDLAPGD